MGEDVYSPFVWFVLHILLQRTSSFEWDNHFIYRVVLQLLLLRNWLWCCQQMSEFNQLVIIWITTSLHVVVVIVVYVVIGVTKIPILSNLFLGMTSVIGANLVVSAQYTL
jgi:hypothetical protein